MFKRKNSQKENDKISADPFGSYTGCPLDPNEQPVQDADDL